MARNLGPVEYSEEDTYSSYEESESPSPGGSTSLEGLTDVDISNPSDGQTLVYNATTGKWENGASGGGDSIYCIDASVVPKSVTIDGVEYTEIYLDAYLDSFPFYIVPVAVIRDAKPFYLKTSYGDAVSTFYPYACNYSICGPIQDDTTAEERGLTVTGPVFTGKTELDYEYILIPDTAEFKTVGLPR